MKTIRTKPNRKTLPPKRHAVANGTSTNVPPWSQRALSGTINRPIPSPDSRLSGSSRSISSGCRSSMQFIGDEVSGGDEVIYQAIEGNRSGGEVHLVLIGNPMQTSGAFYEAFTHAPKHSHTPHTSSEEAASFQTDV